MDNVKQFESTLKVFVITFAVFISGCVGLQAKDDEQPSEVEQTAVVVEKTQYEMEYQQLKAQVTELSNEVARLELKLLEKQSEINQLLQSQRNAIREAVRAKSKLRSHSSKAGAVANMVETKIALKAINPEQLNEQQQSIHAQAKELIAMSDKALDEGNIEGASFLSGKARQLIMTINGQSSNGEKQDRSLARVHFISPLSMKTAKRSNVRDIPDLKGKVLFQLQSGVQVRALAHSDAWIQIEDARNRKGWVYYQLLKMVQ